jgi:hypothetical protein
MDVTAARPATRQTGVVQSRPRGPLAMPARTSDPGLAQARNSVIHQKTSSRRLAAIASSLQIRSRWLARHRWWRDYLRAPLELIIRRVLRRRYRGRYGRGWFGASPRRQPPLDRGPGYPGSLRPLLIAWPEHTLSLPPQPTRCEYRTSGVQTDTEHDALHALPSFAATHPFSAAQTLTSAVFASRS